MKLIKYDAARKSLQEANFIDEVKSIKDKYEAIRAYARQAKDFELCNWASEIRIRAERRMGEMLRDQEMQKPGEHWKEKRSQGETVTPTLAEVGITKSMSSRAQKIASVPEEEFEAVISKHKEDKKELTSATVQRLVKAGQATERRKMRVVPTNLPEKSGRYQIIHEEFQNTKIKAGSIDVIITDPPYPKKYLSLYGDLARFSSRVLKPGGLMVVMCGQSYLPQILADMVEHINYLWMASYLTPGGQSVQIFPRKVNTFWKPLLMFSKGEYSGEWYGDVCKSGTNDNDKTHHHWGQSESGMADIVQRFSLPMQTVLDPLCGAGTTGVVALELGRKFIGIDSDIESINTTKERICA